MEHEDTERYDPGAVEAKWQAVWADERAFEVPNPDLASPPDESAHTRSGRLT